MAQSSRKEAAATDLNREPQVDRALLVLAQRRAEGFLSQAAEALAVALEARWVGIAAWNPEAKQLSYLSRWVDGCEAGPWTFEPAATPSAPLYDDSGTGSVLLGKGFCSRFSKAARETEIGPLKIATAESLEPVSSSGESYLAQALTDDAGRLLGHLSVIDDRECLGDPREWPLVHFLVQRVAAEIVRLEIERSRQERTERYDRALGSAGAALWDWDVDTGKFYLASHLGWSGRQPGLFDWSIESVHPDDHETYLSALRSYLRGEAEHFECEYRVRIADGSYRWLFTLGSGTRAADGRVHRMSGSSLDVTERKRIEAELEETRAARRALAETVPVPVALTSAVDGRILYWNQQAAEILGVDDETGFTDAANYYARPEERPVLLERLKELGHLQDVELQLRRIDGEVIDVLLNGTLIQHRGENALLFTFVDITERKEMERRIRQSEEQNRTLVNGLVEGIAVWDDDGRVIFANQKMADYHGYSLDELIGCSYFEDTLPVEVAEMALERHAQRRSGQLRDEPIEHHFKRRDGSIRWGRSYTQRIEWNGETANLSVLVDITDQRETQKQLAQAQKMEAVGQLTGGVAHDFNNLLAVILGNLDLLYDRMPADEATRRLLQAAAGAADRGATLTRRLLAFSRKQLLQPEVVDPGVLVSTMTEMLARTLGEDVGIEFVRQAGPWKCSVDPHELETALLNLAINARDAMWGRGGKLTIETANVRFDEEYAARQPDLKAGQYVMLAVSDTGCGMDEDVRNRVFEPFFTTKKRGRGSGLGLSMVFGFVKQSGGHVTIYSEVGQGTTVKIYLPRAEGGQVGEGEVSLLPSNPRAHDETVLVVEDDGSVREMVVDLLRSLDYVVVDANSGEAAIELLDHSQPMIDLLITDVVLAGEMGGRELAHEVLRRLPSVRVLYMSGYTDNAIVHHGRLDEGVQILQKPFHRMDLARKVRAVLDETD